MICSNVGKMERWLRIASGLLMLATGLFGLKGTPLGYIVAGSGAFTFTTGLLRWCPSCEINQSTKSGSR
jgi:hypothetical protein